MAAVPCSPWNAQSVRNSDQTVACIESSALASQWQLPRVTFLLVVANALQRLGLGAVGGFAPLSDYTACDGEANANNLFVCLNSLSAPIQANEAELEQIIAWQLGNALCANNV